MEIQERVLLAPLTTFGIGGPARFFARATSIPELYQVLEFAQEKNLKTFILGGGSNVLFSDEGFNGLVIRIEISALESVDEDDTALVVAGAGESWDAVVARAVEKNLWGIENLSGIPGTVGGAVVQNIGAYGASLSQILEWVEVVDTTENRSRTFTAEECKFGYRDSIFKQEPGRYIVLHAALRLSVLPKPNLTYKDLAERCKGVEPSLQDIREAILLIRAGKFPDLSVEGSAGSFFKNPVMPEAQAKKLQEIHPAMPVFSLPESQGIKVPLGWVLDHVLGMRGYTEGPVRLYEHQALVVVAQKNSTAQEVKNLALLVQKKVFDACAIVVEPEVHIVEH